MTVTVYIDVLFLINFLIGIILITGTASILRFRLSILRLTIGAAVCSLYSCIMFFPYTHLLYTVIGRILFSLLFVMIFFKKYKLIELGKAVCALFVISLIFSGFTYFVASILTDKLNRFESVISNGVPYLKIDIKILLTAVILAYGLCILFIRISDRNMSRNKIIFDTDLVISNKVLSEKILCDTGCELVEPLSESPIILIGVNYDIDMSNFEKVRYVKIKTASVDEEGDIVALIKADSIFVKSNEITINHNKCYIGFIKKEFTKDGLYTAIANPNVFESRENNENNKYKEVIFANDCEIKEEKERSFSGKTEDTSNVSKALKL